MFTRMPTRGMIQPKQLSYLNRGVINMKVKSKLFVDKDGNQHTIKYVDNKDNSKILYSADDILIMMGYGAQYSTLQNHHFVNPLRNKASGLYKVPTTKVSGKYKYCTKEQAQVLCSVSSKSIYKYLVDDFIAQMENRFEEDKKKFSRTSVNLPCEFSQESYNRGDLPLVGNECEYSVDSNPFRWCKLNYIGEDIVVFQTKTSKEVVVKLDDIEFRPLEFEKKITVADMMEVATAGMSLSDFAAKLYEYGYNFNNKENPSNAK